MHNELGSGEEVAATLELELAREASPSHSLFGQATTAIGFMQKCPNDFLFSINNDSGTFAWVHLTWQRESNADFPRCTHYVDWNDFVTHAPVAG